jgi:hypothetical protein
VTGDAIAVRLDELDVAIGAAASDFDEHATTLSHKKQLKIKFRAIT